MNGLTHEECLLQLPFEANCLNWVLGHIVVNRSHCLEALDVAHSWREEVRALYHTGKPPIKPADRALRLETLMADLDESLHLLQPALENMSLETLNEPFRNYRGEKTRQGHLAGFHWHEAYHIGQIEVLRALALSSRKN